MWEIIRKNKIKSSIVLFISAVCYSIIYGIVCAVVIICFLPDNYKEMAFKNQNFLLIILILGILIALGIFLLKFFLAKNKPFKLENNEIYPVSKTANKKLYNIVEEVAIASGVSKIPKIYIWDTNVLNAYACGLSPKDSSIVVSKKLLEILSRDELQGVIAHEMSHIINRDTTYLLCSGVMFAAASMFAVCFKSFLSGSRRNKGNELILILLLISLIGQGICFVLFMFISRKREYLADACASVYTRYPKGLADALLKIEQNASKHRKTENTNQLVNASCIVPLFKKGKGDDFRSTHPSTKNRIKVLLNMTSADYMEYEKRFKEINKKSLLPKSVIENSKEVKIKEVKEIKPEATVLGACAIDSAVENEKQIQLIKENKQVLQENINIHREVETMVRNLSGYYMIDCDCMTKLKIPPSYKNQIVICPHCKKKHLVQ